METLGIAGYVAKNRKVGEARPASINSGWAWYAPEWNNCLVIKPGDKDGAFDAMLYTVNGRGPGWLLIQHKEMLGKKTVTSIIVWNSAEDEGEKYELNMLLEIGDLA